MYMQVYTHRDICEICPYVCDVRRTKIVLASFLELVQPSRLRNKRIRNFFLLLPFPFFFFFPCNPSDFQLTNEGRKERKGKEIKWKGRETESEVYLGLPDSHLLRISQIPIPIYICTDRKLVELEIEPNETPGCDTFQKLILHVPKKSLRNTIKKAEN